MRAAVNNPHRSPIARILMPPHTRARGSPVDITVDRPPAEDLNALKRETP